MSTLICDFCSQANPGWRFRTPIIHAYLAKGEETQPIRGASFDEWWATCELCARFVRMGDPAGLTARSLETFGLATGIRPEELPDDALGGAVVALRELHETVVRSRETELLPIYGHDIRARERVPK